MVTLDVPETFGELESAFLRAPVFVFTYAIFAVIWFAHHRFHRRYGLEDAPTVVWNLVLLFLVLLYVYPLKFLAGTLCEMFHLVPSAAAPGEAFAGLRREDMGELMLFYGAGVAAIFLVLAAMVRHALARADDLGLDGKERYLARAEIRGHLLTVGVAAASLLLVLLGDRFLPWAGMIYMLMGPLHAWEGRRTLRGLEAVG